MFAKGRITTTGDVFRDEKSLAFDGSNDYVDCGTNFESTLLNSDFSFSIWVKFVDGRPPSTDLYMFGTKDGNDNFWFRIETDGDVAFYYKEGTTQSNLVASGYLADGASNWIHFVGTLSDSAQKIYANGVVIASGTASLDTSGFAQDTNRNLVIGARNNAGTVGNYLPCNISEVAFYTSALTINQVKTIYNGREPYNHKEGVASGNLQAWYRMGDGALDSKGTDNILDWNGIIADEVTSKIGNELVANKTFSGSSNWTLGTGWAIGLTGLVGTNFTGDVTQSLAAEVNKTYQLSVNITDVGDLHDITLISFGGNLFYIVQSGADNDTGLSKGYMRAANTNDLKFTRFGHGSPSVTVKSISIKEVTGNAAVMLNMSPVSMEGDTP